MRIRTSRKTFIRGLGAATVALPFLRIITGRAAAAAPKRLVIFATPNGTVMNDFFPAGGAILEPLNPFAAKMSVMRDIDMASVFKDVVPKDHLPDYPNALTGVYTPDGKIKGITIDQAIANHINGGADKTKIHSLYMGAMAGSYYPLIAKGTDQPIAPSNDPKGNFDRIFADITTTPGQTPPPAMPDPAMERLRAQRRSMLDALQGDLADVRCQLGSEEKHKFDAHITSLRELELELTSDDNAAPKPVADVAACAKPPAPTAGTGGSDWTQMPRIIKAQMDNVIGALTCDVTRVVVLQVGHGASKVDYGFTGAPGTHHGNSHGSEGVTAGPDERTRRIREIDKWHAQQLAYLVGKLDAIPEGGGTFLDNCAVLWIHEQSDGNSHNRRNMPYVLLGSCGGYFKMGMKDFMGNKQPHNGLLAALGQAMGVPMNSFGDPAFAGAALLAQLKA